MKTQWTPDVPITSLLCQNDVAMSFWQTNDVIITSRVLRESVCLVRWVGIETKNKPEWVVCVDICETSWLGIIP